MFAQEGARARGPHANRKGRWSATPSSASTPGRLSEIRPKLKTLRLLLGRWRRVANRYQRKRYETGTAARTHGGKEPLQVG
jgi:hypothetical protein